MEANGPTTADSVSEGTDSLLALLRDSPHNGSQVLDDEYWYLPYDDCMYGSTGRDQNSSSLISDCAPEKVTDALTQTPVSVVDDSVSLLVGPVEASEGSVENNAVTEMSRPTQPPSTLAPKTSKQRRGSWKRLVRRAAIACVACRNRKVRCDVSSSGIPCANCAHFNSSCSVAPGKKETKRRSSVGINKSIKKKQLVTNLDEAACSPVPNDMPTVDQDGSEATTENEAGAEMHLQCWQLPSYLDTADRMLILVKGAFSVPKAALGGLIDSFCRFAYCQCPVVDPNHLAEIFKSVGEDIDEINVSPLLLNAIMLNASMYAPEEVIHAAGYQSRKAAVKDFRNRVRLIYNLNCEKDAVVILQSLLLLACVADDIDSDKGQTHWITVAVSLCYHLDLHHYPRYESSKLLNDGTSHQRKRLWWTCFVLDQLIAVSHGQTSCINQDAWDVPFLDMADFELSAIGDIIDLAPAQRLAECFIDKVKLSLPRSGFFSKQSPSESTASSSNYCVEEEDYDRGLDQSMFGSRNEIIRNYQRTT